MCNWTPPVLGILDILLPLVVPSAINGLTKAGQVVYCCFWITSICQESLLEGAHSSLALLSWPHYCSLDCMDFLIMGGSAELITVMPLFSKFHLREMALLWSLFSKKWCKKRLLLNNKKEEMKMTSGEVVMNALCMASLHSLESHLPCCKG
jgi:hypothetical protein